ncbi:M48 family metallopeptidase, partial [Candidatus Omnitrophota bacterium]
MNVYLILILTILFGEYILNLIVDNLNLRHAAADLPQEFAGFYDREKYNLSQRYLKETTRFRLNKEGWFTFLFVSFILIGGFNFVDQLARGLNRNYILTGLIFAGILMLSVQIFNIPFSYYRTFVIEEKYGFNRTSLKTFILDILKSWSIGAIIAGLTFSCILWFFAHTGEWAWVYCWLALILFQIFLLFIAPVVIMPWFNKFIPLEQGELKTAIERYAAQEDFKLKGIFKMDASRRTSKSNAFFTGLGKYKRIALFDTLITTQTVDELVSVLAHEIGHYKKRHILKNILLSVLTTGIMFYILSLLINNPGLFAAFGMESTSIYASLFFFAILYTPLNMIVAIFANYLSRKHEYQADGFSVSTYKRPEAFIKALKKLSVDNLSNLTPHPVKVFFDYSHPPVLKRIQAIR